MKKLQQISLILFLLIFSIQGWTAEKIALTLKARGQTSLKRSNEENFKTGVKPGTSLFNEDQIKTGDDGYAVLVFLDDKTQIKVRENSEMIISGTRTTEAISKQIAMQIGTLKAEISPQRKGEFVIATPTSVASVKGTVFWLISDPVMGDVFYGLSGFVEVTNNESGAVVVVGANETGTSTPDGQVNVGTTPAGGTPADDDEDSDTSNILRIQLQNNQGDIKDIKIEY
ncbi:MAG: FecR family protein [Candidatus Marinimicrobia bacterium]|nr:FecR family protein [Candidatus Neomarinimicrobiota bacterium]